MYVFGRTYRAGWEFEKILRKKIKSIRASAEIYWFLLKKSTSDAKTNKEVVVWTLFHIFLLICSRRSVYWLPGWQDATVPWPGPSQVDVSRRIKDRECIFPNPRNGPRSDRGSDLYRPTDKIKKSNIKILELQLQITLKETKIKEYNIRSQLGRGHPERQPRDHVLEKGPFVKLLRHSKLNMLQWTTQKY